MRSDRPLAVLHVVPSYWPATAYGGPIESVHGLCVALAKGGTRIEVLTTDADGDRRLELPSGRDREPVPGLRVRYARRFAGDSIAPGLLARLAAAVGRADVVHLTAVYSFPTLPTLAAARMTSRGVVWSPRGSLMEWQGATRRGSKRLWRLACRLLAPRRTLLHATSEEEAESSRNAFPRLDAMVIPNGVSIPEPFERPPRGEELRLTFLGRLHPIKGLENLLDACAVARARGFEKWSLRIAGGGERAYREELERRADVAGLGDRVRFLGPVAGEDKEDLLRTTDVVVVPSHSENFGIVVAEALAHGCAVVASTGTPWRRLEAEGCGFWVDPEPERLAAVLARLPASDLAAMGRAGQAWMRREFSWESAARRMVEAYRKVAA